MGRVVVVALVVVGPNVEPEPDPESDEQAVSRLSPLTVKPAVPIPSARSTARRSSRVALGSSAIVSLGVAFMSPCVGNLAAHGGSKRPKRLNRSGVVEVQRAAMRARSVRVMGPPGSRRLKAPVPA